MEKIQSPKRFEKQISKSETIENIKPELDKNLFLYFNLFWKCNIRHEMYYDTTPIEANNVQMISFSPLTRLYKMLRWGNQNSLEMPLVFLLEWYLEAFENILPLSMANLKTLKAEHLLIDKTR